MLGTRIAEGTEPLVMPEILAIIGLALATVLYALLVRRRSTLRIGLQGMSRALLASN